MCAAAADDNKKKTRPWPWDNGPVDARRVRRRVRRHPSLRATVFVTWWYLCGALAVVMVSVLPSLSSTKVSEPHGETMERKEKTRCGKRTDRAPSPPPRWWKQVVFDFVFLVCARRQRVRVRTARTPHSNYHRHCTTAVRRRTGTSNNSSSTTSGRRRRWSCRRPTYDNNFGVGNAGKRLTRFSDTSPCVRGFRLSFARQCFSVRACAPTAVGRDSNNHRVAGHRRSEPTFAGFKT